MESKRVYTETFIVFLTVFIAFPLITNFLYLVGFLDHICVQNCNSFITEWLPVVKRANWFLPASSFLGILSSASFFVGKKFRN